MLKRRVISLDFDAEPEYTITPIEDVFATEQQAVNTDVINYEPGVRREYIPGTTYITRSGKRWTAPINTPVFPILHSMKVVFTGRFYNVSRSSLQSHSFSDFYSTGNNILKNKTILVVGRTNGITKIDMSIRYGNAIYSEVAFLQAMREASRNMNLEQRWPYTFFTSTYNIGGTSNDVLLNNYILLR